MKFLTKEALDSLNDKYYKGRYSYFKEVIDQIKLMDNINTTLELGPYKSPLVEGGDVIDLTDRHLETYPIEIGKLYKHDCSVTPYPFEDKKYDLVIALQVLEHLGTLKRPGKNQIEVFKEFSRISKRAIITLPYKWNVPTDKHHMIDEKVIDYWAQGLKPYYEKISGTGPKRILRIYYFDDNMSIEHSKKLQEHADFQILKKLEQERRKRKELENKFEQVRNKTKELEKLLI